jgi:Rps23 Pro-64 3,4-dihydroxylase Tpa1-like proline 4-hydroxylase
MSDIVSFDNVLTNSLLEVLREVCKTGEFHHSYVNWGDEVIKDSNPVLIKNLNQHLSNRIISEIKLLLPSHTEFKCMWYGWIRGSYIPWHADNNAKFGATIYLNEYWDDDWGGYFAYKKNDEIKCIKPEFNKMILIEPPIEHTVFNTSSVAPIRETIQIFGR